MTPVHLTFTTLLHALGYKDGHLVLNVNFAVQAVCQAIGTSFTACSHLTWMSTSYQVMILSFSSARKPIQ